MKAAHSCSWRALNIKKPALVLMDYKEAMNVLAHDMRQRRNGKALL